MNEGTDSERDRERGEREGERNSATSVVTRCTSVLICQAACIGREGHP